MSDNYSINGIGGIDKKRNDISTQAAGSMHAAGAAMQPAALQGVQQTAGQRGDSIQFSDEIKETQNIGGSSNIDTLRSEFSKMREQLSAEPSGKDASSTLVQDVMSAQMERNGLQGAQPQAELQGLEPGMHNGGVVGVNGIQSGMEPGMQSGGAYSSRYSPSTGYEPGGGKTTPKMAKLQTDYADALKAGHGVSPMVNNMVMNTFADSGKTADPIKEMTGIKKN